MSSAKVCVPPFLLVFLAFFLFGREEVARAFSSDLSEPLAHSSFIGGVINTLSYVFLGRLIHERLGPVVLRFTRPPLPRGSGLNLLGLASCLVLRLIGLGEVDGRTEDASH